jgi:hypothetical protein
MLEKQKHIYQELANNVLTEEYYKSSDIHIEKKKFNSFTNEMKNKEIFALRNKIKDKNGEKNKNETEDSLVQRARQRMMRRNQNKAKANRNNIQMQQKISSKATNLNSNKKIGNLSSTKIKENSNSPNASLDNIIDSNTTIPHASYPNKDCKI